MNRKTVRIDIQTLWDLVKALDEYRATGVLYKDKLLIGGAIASLSQFAHFHGIPAEAFEVTVPNELKPDPNLAPLPDYGDLMTLDEFISCVRLDLFTDDDGGGCYYATEAGMSYEEVSPSDIRCGIINNKWTHVVWFNK